MKLKISAARVALCLGVFLCFSGSQVYSATEGQSVDAKQAKALVKQRTKAAREYAKLHRKAVVEGKVRVIAKVALEGATEASKGSYAKNITALKTLAKQLNAEVKREIGRLGIVAITADPVQLNTLLDSGMIESLHEDYLIEPQLSESASWIGADTLWSYGYTGQSHAIAILDTGYQLDHPFLVNRIVEEACFSTNDTVSISTCPNGQEEMFGTGAAADCTATFGGSCNHGTHVAGIAAGDNGSLFGVAPGADLVVVNVFHYNTSYNSVRAWGSDMLAGLDWVLNQATTPNITATNMSIGGGVHTQPCDNDLLRSTIAALRLENIATVISAGNDYSSSGVSWPGCIPEAITVGATYKDADDIAGFSNTSALVDILAPGVSVYSSVPGNGYAWFNGTSMAAPHIAGAFAALRSAFPSATVDQIETAMKTSGVSVVHGTSGLALPRLDLMGAYFALETSSTAPLVYQAEDQTWSQAAVETEHDGYTGSGYVNTVNVAGSWVEFQVNAPAAGNYQLSLRYANGTSASRSTDIIVNGITAVAAHPYATTGAWSSWDETVVGVSLNAGSNTLRLLAVSSSGAPNLDRIELVAQSGGNQAPVVENPPADYSFYETQNVATAMIGAVFSDPDGDALDYEVSSSDSSIATVTLSAAGLPHLNISPVAPGVATVTLSATDGLATATTQFQVTVMANELPYVVSDIPDYLLERGSAAFAIDLTAIFVDPDNDGLMFDYQKSDDDNFNVSMPNASSLLINPQAAGTLVVYVSAEDGKFGSASLSFTVTVQDESEVLDLTKQAEWESWSAGVIESEHSGYHGTGYVNTPNSSGQWLGFNVDVPNSGTYRVSVRYANGTSSNRSVNVAVDGITVLGAVNFAGTGAWSNWSETTFDLNLTAGFHDIRLDVQSSNGAANIDQYRITKIVSP